MILEYRDCSSIEGHGDVKRSQFTLNTIKFCTCVVRGCLLLVYSMYGHIPKVYIHYFYPHHWLHMHLLHSSPTSKMPCLCRNHRYTWCRLDGLCQLPSQFLRALVCCEERSSLTLGVMVAAIQSMHAKAMTDDKKSWKPGPYLELLYMASMHVMV